MLHATLPGGPYQIPATLQATFLFVLDGAIGPPRISTRPDQCRAVPRFRLSGPTTRSRWAESLPGTELLVVPVQPGQLVRLTGLSASDVVDVVLPLTDIAPASLVTELEDGVAHSKSLTERIAYCERFLSKLYLLHVRRAPDFVLAPGLLSHSATEIAATMGLSLRQMERRFLRSYGQSLRQFRRQVRYSRMLFYTALYRSDTSNWSDIAAAAGYCDQAHLIKDVQHYTGLTPTSVMRGALDRSPSFWAYRLGQAEAWRVFGID